MDHDHDSIDSSEDPVAWEGIELVTGDEETLDGGRRRLRWLAFALLLILAGSSLVRFTGLRRGVSPSSAPLAQVNSVPITRAELEKEAALRQVLTRLTTGAEAAAPSEEALLRRLIEEELIWQEAIRTGTEVTDEEVSTILENLRSTTGLSEEEVAQVLNEAGLTPQDLEALARRALTINRFIEEEVLAGVPATQAQARYEGWLDGVRRTAQIEAPDLATTASRVAPQVGALAPDFTLTDLGGQQVTLSQLRGQILLINFWATWCPPCRIEMPAIQAAYEKYRDQGFTVLAVDIREGADLVRRFVEQFGLTFPVLLDETGAVSARYRTTGIPASFFVDRAGVITDRHIGAMSPAAIEKYVARALEGTGEPVQAPPPQAADAGHQIHWHARLTITIQGRRQEVAGLEGDGQYIDIHRQGWTLGEALAQYGVPFSENCIYSFCDGEGGTLQITINGQPVEDFRGHTLQDGDEIAIIYR